MTKYTLDDLRKEVGDEPTEKMVKMFNGEDHAVEWFYEHRIKPYDNMTPYELHQENKESLEGMLDSLEWSDGV